jgi:hypothetical protein
METMENLKFKNSNLESKSINFLELNRKKKLNNQFENIIYYDHENIKNLNLDLNFKKIIKIYAKQNINKNNFLYSEIEKNPSLAFIFVNSCGEIFFNL